MKKTNAKGGAGENPTKDTTQRQGVFPAADTIFGITSINTLRKPTEITREELRAVTKDGKDVIYTALAHVALTRGIWILKEA